jgi:tRNA nucleotidyltransferase (CCA-adding enzyme)
VTKAASFPNRVGLRELPAPLRRGVEQARRLAADRGTSLHLVGGAVRDLLLARPVVDVDLVVDSDAGQFAQDLGGRMGAPVTRHGRFGTATIALPNALEIDVATRRRERYARPGALPTVEPGTLEEDLARRDFAINAMALDLTAARSPRLVDPFGGRADLLARRVRMLHPASAWDDPTRGFRAARYANRLSFRIEPRTAGWIREASGKGSLATISGDRLRRELERMFGEPRPGRAVGLLASLGLARALHPALPADATARRGIDRAQRFARESGGAPFAAVLLAWTWGLDAKAAALLASALGLSGEPAKRLASWPARLSRLRRLGGAARASSIDSEISDWPAEEIAAAAAVMPPAGRRALMRTVRLRATMKPRVSGGDLVAAGIAPGPWVSRALAATRAARLDGRVGPREEKAYAITTARRLAARG